MPVRRFYNSVYGLSSTSQEFTKGIREARSLTDKGIEDKLKEVEGDLDLYHSGYGYVLAMRRDDKELLAKYRELIVSLEKDTISDKYDQAIKNKVMFFIIAPILAAITLMLVSRGLIARQGSFRFMKTSGYIQEQQALRRAGLGLITTDPEITDKKKKYRYLGGAIAGGTVLGAGIGAVTGTDLPLPPRARVLYAALVGAGVTAPIAQWYADYKATQEGLKRKGIKVVSPITRDYVKTNSFGTALGIGALTGGTLGALYPTQEGASRLRNTIGGALAGSMTSTSIRKASRALKSKMAKLYINIGEGEMFGKPIPKDVRDLILIRGERAFGSINEKIDKYPAKSVWADAKKIILGEEKLENLPKDKANEVADLMIHITDKVQAPFKGKPKDKHFSPIGDYALQRYLQLS